MMNHWHQAAPVRAAAVLLSVLAFLATPAGAQVSNGVLREVYSGIGGGTVSDLTSNPSYPCCPALESLQPTFEAPTDWADNYGTRMRALIIPPVTGNYTFWIASDDGSALYLGTNEDPATKVQIATVNAWTSSREWTKETNQMSAPRLLTAGQRYYIEALQKEGGGGDNLAVRWQLPGGVWENPADPSLPIPTQRLVPYGLTAPIISDQPTNFASVEGGAASFTVRLQRMIGATFQWYRSGVPIPGATNFTHALPIVTLGDHGATFFCSITNALGGTNSAVATLSVLADTNRPTLNTAGNLGEPGVVFVVFSEPVEPATATNAANYAITGGPAAVTVLRAGFGADTRTILLTTTPMTAGVTYTLTVNNVRDRATTPNSILPNSTRTFSVQVRPLDIGYLSLPRETIGPSSRRHGVVISELMFHPTNRTDGRNLEFIELYNSQPWFEELGGWRISGAVDFTFPSNAVLPSRSYLVIAANPVDFRAIYSGVAATNVFGPFLGSNGLQNSSGTLRLRNARDAVVFEMEYSGDAPFPAHADGGGHSLVLARPSYGERDARAWLPSDLIGGNPGFADPPGGNSFRNLLINEFLAHSDPPQEDYVELFNYGSSSLNLNGMILTDDPATNKCVLSTNILPSTTLPARSFVRLTASQLGFSLASGGEALYLKNSTSQRVIDAVKFGAQENGVPTGRWPDGAPTWTRLAAPTPGTNNAPFKPSPVVINEILYNPPSGEDDDEFVELHNASTNTVNLGGWRLRDGVSFNIPPGTTLAPGGYLVIARNAARLRSQYPGLNTANCLGDYSGSLGNRGERLELNFPDEVISTNAQGQLRTNTIHIPVDEVTYGTGGRWGRWADGDGSSLELRDPRADRRLAPNWADSDESAKSQWVTVEATGTMDNGWADATQLHVTLLGAGEALLDNVEVLPAGGTNVIGNGTFESGTAGWVFQGNHNDTGWEATEGFGSARSLHLRATGRGDAGANRVRTQLPYTLSPGTVVTLRAKVRWLKGNPNVLLRLRGNWMEAPGYTLTATNLGTPGAINSRSVANAGPAITEVRHDPPLPAASQPVLVLARVHDPDGLAYLAVNYRVDPATTFTALAMTNNGSGLYSAVLPAQAAGVTVAFHVTALDNHPVPAGSTFPSDAPVRECVVRWGDNVLPGTLGTYRMWLTQTNVSRWIEQEKMSNKPKDTTFVYGTNRVVYNAGAWFHGSPYHSPSYDTPTGAQCDYDMFFNKDDSLLGENDINLFMPGNGCCDGTAQAEMHAYWFGGQFGLPHLYCRPVFVYVNGVRRAAQVYYDMQQPNSDYIEQWFPDDADGELHKIMLGFEFGDLAYGASEPGYAVVGANLARYLTTGGAFKQARYRSTWPLRAVSPREQNEYTNLFSLVNNVLTTAPIGSEAYTTTLQAVTDVEGWFKVHVTQHLYNNPDSFSYGGGQNAFAYKPTRDPWKLFLWDVDFAFGGSPTDPNLLGIGGADHGPRNDHPPFARIYWQALMEAANGMMTPARSDTILDARYNGMVAGGATGLGSPAGIKSFIAQRRSYILSQIASNQAPFAITSNGGMDFTTNRNLITLTGTAPLEVRTLLVNGAAYPVTWTSLHTWVLRVPLLSGTNTLVVTGLDSRGAASPGISATLRVNYTGADEQPQDRIVINEIMYHPQFANAGFVELHNLSASNAFDLSGWRLEGAGLDFPNGTVIEPQQYLVVAKDRTVFGETYGPTIPVAAEFPGNLDNGGETLTLRTGGPSPAVIDQVTFDDDVPWPVAADGFGSSLQLIDPTRDNNRVANWAAAGGVNTNAPQTLLTLASTWRYQQTQNLDGISWTAPAYNDSGWASGPGLLAVENCNCLPDTIRTTLTLATGRTTFYFRTRFTLNGSPAGAALKLYSVLDDGMIVYLNGQEIFRQGMPAGPVSYASLATPGVGDATLAGPFILSGAALLPGENVLAVEVHQSGATSSDVVLGLNLETTYDVISRSTPGAVNSVRSSLAAFPTLWLNEVLATNFFLGTNGITDRFGERDPWVELYNGGTNTISLAGCYLSDAYTNLTRWAFPASATIGPRQFLIVWLDGETNESIPTELHAAFRPVPGVGSVVLSAGSNAPFVLDYLNYSVTSPGRSYGSYPDGAVSGRRSFSVVTPAATNNPATPPVDVRINEWMADNFFTLDDPGEVGPNYEDWFELYNPGTNAVDLTGYFLSDSLTNTTHWQVPDGTIIPARGYLLVWADGETGQNGNYGSDLHAPFSLSSGGEALALFAPDGQLVDGVGFGPQTTDISQGRFPDGAATVFPMTNATPRGANVLSSENSAPALAQIADKTVNEGAVLSFVAVATDTNVPAQTLTFSLDPGAPTNATIHPATGTFNWTPDEGQGPGVFPVTIRVTDNGVPPLSATRTLTITVNEVNNAPVLGPLLSRNVAEGSLLNFTNTATDSDTPAQSLTFSLDAGAPTNAAIHPVTGVFTWTPTEAQGPGNYSIGIRVTDSGDPPASNVRLLSVFVSEVNQAPVLSFPSPQAVHAGAPLAFQASVTDADLPVQSISFSLEPGARAGAGIDAATGVFTWTPTVADLGTNLLTVRATDNAAPPAMGTRLLTVIVAPALEATLSRLGGQVRITFPTLVGRSYRVEYKDQLGDPAWAPLGSPRTATGSSLEFLDQLGPVSHRFYRVQLDP